MKYVEPEMDIVEIKQTVLTTLSVGDENTTVPDLGTM